MSNKPNYFKNSGYPKQWKNSDKTFHEWWNPDKFNLTNSWKLAQFCSDKFDIWWDPDKFEWNESWSLAQFCSDKFDIWWDADKFNWLASECLKTYCSAYEHIWAADYIMNMV